MTDIDWGNINCKGMCNLCKIANPVNYQIDPNDYPQFKDMNCRVMNKKFKEL